MRINAQQLGHGDVIRGLGLKVDIAEPANDTTTHIVGALMKRTDNDPETGQRVYVETATVSVNLPNTHRVNVVRSDAGFRQDRIGWVLQAVGRYAADIAEADDSDTVEEGQAYAQGVRARFVHDLTRVANAPRGRFIFEGQVDEFLGDADPILLDVEVTLDGLDAIEALPQEDDFLVLSVVPATIEA